MIKKIQTVQKENR